MCGGTEECKGHSIEVVVQAAAIIIHTHTHTHAHTQDLEGYSLDLIYQSL
jgi:hypothetical protein